MYSQTFIVASQIRSKKEGVKTPFDLMKRNRFSTQWISGYVAATTMLVLTAGHISAQTSDPVIVSQPQDVSAGAGTAVQFSITLSGTMPIFNNWYLLTNSTAILLSSSASNNPGGTVTFTKTLVAQNPQSYFAISSNSVGVVTSRVATLTIQPVPPTITNQPPDIQTNAGASVTLKVSATGTAPLSYQWYYNGGALAAGTKSSLTFTNVSTNASGSYQANVSNNYGSATSRVATLTILPVPPTILDQPSDIQANAGGSVTLRVSATGYAPLSYQWYYNGNALAAATKSSLTFTNVSTNASGSYQALVSNDYGSATSRIATVTILPVPPTISGQPQDIQTNTGASITFKVTAFGYAPLSYQWYYNGSALAAPTGSSLSLTNVSTNNAGSYQAIVSDNYGSTTSRVATLTIGPPAPQPPTITTQPSNVVISSSGPSTAFFSVTATGALPLIYQWYFKGSALPSANASSLSVSNAAGDASNAGSYYVRITNGIGSVTSHVATLTFQSLSPAQVTLLSHSTTYNWDVLLLSSLETNKNYTLQGSSDMRSWWNIYSFLASVTQRQFTNAIGSSTNVNGFYYRMSSP